MKMIIKGNSRMMEENQRTQTHIYTKRDDSNSLKCVGTHVLYCLDEEIRLRKESDCLNRKLCIIISINNSCFPSFIDKETNSAWSYLYT